jgi:hypothetical protein
MSTTTPKKMEVGEVLKPAAARLPVPSRMTAAVLYGSEDLRIEMIDVPALAAEEVLPCPSGAHRWHRPESLERGYHAK